MEEPVISKQALGGLARARKIRDAYLANPVLCQHCTQAILPKENERLVEVRRRRFCSRSCSNAFHNRQFPKRARLDRICLKCGTVSKEGKSDRKLCEACWQTEAVRIAARTKGETSKRNVYVQAAAVMAASKREKKCQRCGYTKFVDICHIKAVKNFPDTALLSEINALENLIFLCPNCHHELDAGHFNV